MRVSPALLALAACAIFTASPSAAGDHLDPACDSPQPCYEAALQPEPLGAGVTPEDRKQATLKRLETLRKRYPGSIWAKRAGVLTGLLLSEHEPAEAARLFGAARHDLPVLDDYFRLWEAEALLRLGEAPKAASLFESIPQAVPDTVLRNRVAFFVGAAWHQAGECKKATDLLTRAVQQEPHDPAVPTALLNLADCHFRQKQTTKGKSALKEVWVRYPNRPEAQEAEARLVRFKVLKWKPTADDLYGRANSSLNLGLHEEAVKMAEKFLSLAPKKDPRRNEMRIKLGTALFHLKRYDQAKPVFQNLADRHTAVSGDATVWLARVYIAQGDGKQLLALFLSLSKRSLSAEQTAAIQMLVASHHDDQSRHEEAIETYKHVAQSVQDPSQRSEALWRIGWIQYQTGRFREAVGTFEEVMDDPQYAPQALYWTARALDRLQDLKATDHYLRLCQHYAFTYHCQLAQVRTQASGLVGVSEKGGEGEAAVTPARGESGVARNVHYRRAMELKLVGMDHEAARELVWLAEHYARDRAALVELSTLLSEAGAHHHALQLVKLHFKEALERGGESVPQALWSVAYPTMYQAMIQSHAGTIVDPYLVMAVIREESQYDTSALSARGAVGLMQLMPATAQSLTKQHGHPEVGREDLFDHDTNIRVGVLYLEELLKQFSSNVVHAVAAYNAGPNAVAAWIAKHGHKEADEFIELIPFLETRQYVKRVLHSYHEYQRLGGVPCPAHFLDKVC